MGSVILIMKFLSNLTFIGALLTGTSGSRVDSGHSDTDGHLNHHSENDGHLNHHTQNDGHAIHTRFNPLFINQMYTGGWKKLLNSRESGRQRQRGFVEPNSYAYNYGSNYGGDYDMDEEYDGDYEYSY